MEHFRTKKKVECTKKTMRSEGREGEGGGLCGSVSRELPFFLQCKHVFKRFGAFEAICSKKKSVQNNRPWGAGGTSDRSSLDNYRLV